ncbi:hypothetical protein HPL003_13845 [Paenibacillus terrae HPL-003]|uniref:Uncharacterized protein n=1 Tax=Paenibacillus terrae (strain HPL-003) TaxID=985665 RepID=G7VYY0_PAETH|nr:hypothetical protein HPL003_13845 [Paenibacillus terrae HPL-003]
MSETITFVKDINHVSKELKKGLAGITVILTTVFSKSLFNEFGEGLH